MLTALMLPTAGADEPRSGDARSLEVRLGDGTTIVADEGDVEPRSIGSIAIRVYAPADGEFRYDNFQTGVIWPRDGALLRLITADIDSVPGEDIVVVAQSAGSGGYLSAAAFRLRNGVLKHVGSVEGLSPTTDPVSALRKTVQQR